MIFEDLALFSSLFKLVFPQEVGKTEKNLKPEKKFFFKSFGFGKKWTLVSVPNTGFGRALHECCNFCFELLLSWMFLITGTVWTVRRVMYLALLVELFKLHL